MDYISPEDKARLEEQLKACIEMRPKIVEPSLKREPSETSRKMRNTTPLVKIRA